MKQIVTAAVLRMTEHAKLSTMCAITSVDVWQRRNRSRIYSYILPIVCLVYFVPAVQYSWLEKRLEIESGDQDRCYSNFRYWIYSSFRPNTVY